MNATVIALAATLALTACAGRAPTAVAPAMLCPEADPAQPNCRVPKYASVGDLIAGENLVQP